MNNIILNKIKNRFRKFFLKGGLISYSQAGEDLILNVIFLSKKKGVFIDVGANHPRIASNTYFFYKKGWTGINIDAFPEAIYLFKKQRKKDINIESGVSDSFDSLDFYIFQETSYNTFEKEAVDLIKKVSKLKEVKKIPVKPLSAILSQCNISAIDFMSIDVEGFDLRVLKSNDWNKYRPRVILVEEFNHGKNILNSETYEYLIEKGYVYFCFSGANAFYIERNFYNERFNKKEIS